MDYGVISILEISILEISILEISILEISISEFENFRGCLPLVRA